MAKRYGPIIGRTHEADASSKMLGRSNDLRFSLRLAEIVRVDYERMTCDIAYIQGTTPNSEEVPLSAGYWSRRAFVGAMPEVGAVVIVGFTSSHEGRHTRPLILGFIPNGVRTALNFDPLSVIDRNAEDLTLPQAKTIQELDGLYGPTRYKMRKMYPGEILAMSEKGSELILDAGVRLLDRTGQELQLDPSAKRVVLTAGSLIETMTASGARSWLGRVIRDDLNLASDFDPATLTSELRQSFVDAGILYAENDTLLPDINQLPALILPDGRRHSPVTLHGVPPTDPQAQFYLERRLEIPEFEGTPGSPAIGTKQSPFITSVTGTLIGNDAYGPNGRRLYGSPLRAVVFTQHHDTRATDHRLEVAASQNEVAASYYRMDRPDGLGSLMYSHDKEGHVTFSIPASSSAGTVLGEGRSVDGNLQGSTKLVMGASRASDNESLRLDAKGGFAINVGAASRTRRSLDLTTSGGVYVQAGGPDSQGKAISLRGQGDYSLRVSGSIGVLASSGDHLEEASGKREMRSEAYSLHVGTGNLTENVLSSRDTVIGGQESTIIGDGSQRDILSGGEITSILIGDSLTTFGLRATREIEFQESGTHKIGANASLSVIREAGVRGTYAFSAPTGSYSVGLDAGSISLVAGAGSVEIGIASVTTTAPLIVLEGPTQLGSSVAPFSVIGGIPGPSPHLDYLTGLPLRGNPMVRTL